MTETEVAWLAGILEGEGCFDLNRDLTYCPKIRIEMTDKDIVERAAALLGGGGKVRPTKKYKPHHRQAYVFQVSGHQAAITLRLILPYMSERRTERINLILSGAPDHKLSRGKTKGPLVHGKRSTYNNDHCRCDECRAAAVQYIRSRKLAVT